MGPILGAPNFGPLLSGKVLESIELPPRDTNIGQDHDGDGDEDNQCNLWCYDCSLDFDYTALVSKVGGDANVTIEDPEGK